MKKLVIACVLTAATLNLAGCDASKADIGTGSGAVIGGLLGSQFGKGSGQILAIGAGALAGGFLGHAIGQNMDNTDRVQMQQALQSQQQSSWYNQNTGTHYTVLPAAAPKRHRHHGYCREYIQTATVAGKQQQVYGHACRQPDGSWKISQ